MGASVSSGEGGRFCGSVACGYERPKVTGTPDGNTPGGPLNTQVVVVVHDNMGNLVVQPRPNGTISIGTDKSKSTVQLNRPPSLLFKSDGFIAGPAGSEKYKKLEEDDVGGVGGAPDEDDFKGDPERSPNPAELRPRGGTQDSVPSATAAPATPATTDEASHADDYSEKAYTPRSHFTSEPGSPRVGGADEIEEERKELIGHDELPPPTELPAESIAAVNASLTALLQTVSLTQSAYEQPEPKSILANFSAQARGILQSSDETEASSKPDIARAQTLGNPATAANDETVPRAISLPETSKEDARIMRQTRSKIQRDFVDAEKAYHDALAVLMKQYLRPLQNSGERMFLGVTPQQAQDIFGNVETIAKLHDNIYYDLLDDPSSIVDSVSQCAPEFVAYRTYAENFPKCLEALHQLSENKKFLQFLKLKAMSSTNTTFMTYLLMPLERISQYDKSLSGLFQHIPDTDPQKAALANILLSVKSVSTDVARYKTQADNLAQLLDISNAIVKMTNPLQNSGPRYNKKGILKLISSRGTEVANAPEYTFVLFTDWLMWTDHRNKMRFVDQVELKGVGYGVRSGSGDEASAPVRFDLYLTADESSRMCAECPSAADCLEWMTAIQRNLDNLKPASLI